MAAEHSAESQRVFVYGTLMRGEPMHGLLGEAALVAQIRTAPTYTLVLLGAYPAMLRSGSTPIVGELYLIGRSAIPTLDDYEGDQYERATVELEDGTVAIAWFGREKVGTGFHPIPSGDWRAR